MISLAAPIYRNLISENIVQTNTSVEFFTHLSRLEKLKSNNTKLLGIDINKKYTGYSYICNVLGVILSPVSVKPQADLSIHGKAV